MALETLSKLDFSYPHTHENLVVSSLNIDGSLYDVHGSKLQEDIDEIISYTNRAIDTANINFTNLAQQIEQLSGIDTETLQKLQAIITEIESGEGELSAGQSWLTLIDKIKDLGDYTVISYLENYYVDNSKLEVSYNQLLTYVGEQVYNSYNQILSYVSDNYIDNNELQNSYNQILSYVSDNYIDNNELQNSYNQILSYVGDNYISKNEFANAYYIDTVTDVNTSTNNYTLYNIEYDSDTTTLNVTSVNHDFVTEVQANKTFYERGIVLR